VKALTGMLGASARGKVPLEIFLKIIYYKVMEVVFLEILIIIKAEELME
jgi:hypothetical protein